MDVSSVTAVLFYSSLGIYFFPLWGQRDWAGFCGGLGFLVFFVWSRLCGYSYSFCFLFVFQ